MLVGQCCCTLTLVVLWHLRMTPCPTSQLRGCFDYRLQWVQEVRAADEIKITMTTDKLNLSDIFTKCKGNKEFKYRVDQIRAEAK